MLNFNYSDINSAVPKNEIEQVCQKLCETQHQQEFQSIFQSIRATQNGDKCCFRVISELTPIQGILGLKSFFLKAMYDAGLFQTNVDDTIELIRCAINNNETNILKSLGPMLEISELFRRACECEALDVAQWLLGQNDKAHLLNFQDSTGRTPLHFAARTGRKRTVEFLIKSGANLEIRDNYGNTPLLLAAAGGNLSVTNLFIESGANVSVANLNGRTVCSFMRKHFLVLPSYLLDKDNGLTSELESRKLLAHRFGIGGTTQLSGYTINLEGMSDNSAAEALWNAMRDYYDQLKRSLVDPEKCDLWKLVLNGVSETTQKACADLDPNKLSAILDHTKEAIETDVKVQNIDQYLEIVKSGKPLGLPLVWPRHAVGLAIMGNQVALCNKGAGSEGCSGIRLYKIGHPQALKECLHALIEHNSQEFWNIELISKLGLTEELYISQKTQTVGNCSVANRNGIEYSLLYMQLGASLEKENALELAKAIHKGRVHDTKIKALKQYLDKHTKDKRQDPDFKLLGQILGKSTANEAFDRQIGDLLRASELVKHIPQTLDISMLSIQGSSLLHSAATSRNLRKIKQVIDLGADVNAQNLQGQTPLHLAILVKWLEGVKLLLENGADIESATQRGNTPLTSAVLFGANDIVMHLVGSGANLETRTKEGKTPLDIAIEKKNATLIQYLSEHGAKTT